MAGVGSRCGDLDVCEEVSGVTPWAIMVFPSGGRRRAPVLKNSCCEPDIYSLADVPDIGNPGEEVCGLLPGRCQASSVSYTSDSMTVSVPMLASSAISVTSKSWRAKSPAASPSTARRVVVHSTVIRSVTS